MLRMLSDASCTRIRNHITTPVGPPEEGVWRRTRFSSGNMMKITAKTAMAGDENASRAKARDGVGSNGELKHAVHAAIGRHPQSDRGRIQVESAKLDRRRPNERDERQSGHAEERKHRIIGDRDQDGSCEHRAQRQRFLGGIFRG